MYLGEYLNCLNCQTKDQQTRKEANIPNQRPVAQKGPTQRQLVDNTDNANPPLIASQPINDNPIPVRHFEPNPLLELPKQDK